MVKTLISAVGTTDPIRGFHDGPLLHIARVYRPEKIVLIFSEEMLTKQDRIERALNSISDYKPQIIVDEDVIKNDDIYLFDRMFNQLSSIVFKYNNDDDELILNLSSATPQVISAMFAINRINNYNVKAVQVATPEKKSNENLGYENQEDIEALIETNLDNRPDFNNRTIEDEAEKFNESLLKRHLRNLIKSYDYQACYDITSKKENQELLSKKNLGTLNNRLDNFVNVFRKQSLLKDLGATPLNHEAQKALNNYLVIDILNKRGLVADVLIKSKSLAEFMLESYITNKSPKIIVDSVINSNHRDAEAIFNFISKRIEREYYRDAFVNIHSLKNIIEYYDLNDSLVAEINKIIAINEQRNSVAHKLSEITITNKQLKQVSTALKFMLKSIYKIDDHYFSYFDNKNDDMIKLLQ